MEKKDFVKVFRSKLYQERVCAVVVDNVHIFSKKKYIDMFNRNRLSDQLEFYQPTLLLFIPIQELNIVGPGYFIVQ